MQMHLYVTDAIAEAVKKKADALGLSVSRFLADLVRREVGGSWPEGYFESVIGGWQGQPIERPPQGILEAREPLGG